MASLLFAIDGHFADMKFGANPEPAALTVSFSLRSPLAVLSQLEAGHALPWETRSLIDPLRARLGKHFFSSAVQGWSGGLDKASFPASY